MSRVTLPARRTGIDYFRISAAVLLIATGAAKYVSALGSEKILFEHDPVFSMSWRNLFFATGFIEIAIGIFCLMRRNRFSQAVTISGLATFLVMYRLGMYAVGYTRPCNCLGSAAAALGLSDAAADVLLRCVLGYLFIGGVVSMMAHWRTETTSREIEQTTTT